MAKKDDAKRIEARFLAGTLVAFAILSFFVLREYIYFIVGGGLLVFAFYPIHRYVQKGVRQKGLAAGVSLLLVVLVVIGPLFLVGFLVFHDAINFAKTYDPDKINETIQGFLDEHGLAGGAATDESGASNETGFNQTRPGQVANFLGVSAKRFAERIGEEVVAVLPSLAIGLVISGFVIYYGFLDGAHFYTRLRHALPLPDEIEEPLFREVRRVTNVVFVGNILVSIFGGIIGAISFLIFGVPNAIFWGFVMIILGILPVVGAPFVWIPAAGWLFIEGRTYAALGILLLNGLLVVGYIDHILRPRLIGKVAHVHPVIILIGVLGGVEAFGPLGFVIGPLVLAVFIALVRAYTEWHPRWKNRRLEGTEPYHPQAEIEVVEGPAPAPAPEKESGTKDA